ncbi:MAG: hypothetical protein KKB70_07500 [Proteobacteria bacterium]|nr:hypothetical protein [Pseudomonadota bacterium]MBU1612044.1 hypothetical protein [Pseudomonadota bacterium]
MKILFPTLGFAALLLLIPLHLVHAADKLEVQDADSVHQAAIKRSQEYAARALELLQGVEQLNDKALNMGIPTNQLPKADLKQLKESTEELGKLYSHNFFEASLIRDMRLLDNLYKTAMLLYAQQHNYVEQTGSGRGFDQYIAGIKLDREQHFYLEILLYLHRLVPSELEANPGTPSLTPGQ